MLAKDIGIDLGTANVLIYIKGKGIVLNEPSIVVIDTETKRVIAVGKEAKEMLGRTPGKVKAIKPMKDGVIADFELTEIMLNEFIRKAKARRSITRPRILICCPTNITPVEKNALIEAAERMGARKIYIEEGPKVAAIGAGMDISKPTANKSPEKINNISETINSSTNIVDTQNSNSENTKNILEYGTYETESMVDPSDGEGLAEIKLEKNKFTIVLNYAGKYKGTYTIKYNVLICNANEEEINEGGNSNNTTNAIFKFEILNSSKIKFITNKNMSNEYTLNKGFIYNKK